MITASQKDLGVRFGITLLATILVSPIAAALLPPIPSHRVVTRVFLISMILSLIIKRRKSPGEVRGVRAVMVRLRWCRPHRMSRFTAGVVLAVVLLVAMLAVSMLAGGRVWEHKPPSDALWAAVLSAVLSGVAVAFLEEPLFRGYLFNVLGGWLSAFVYAAIHNFRPTCGSPPADGYDPLLALKTIPRLMEGWGDPRNVTLGIGTLFIFGLALNTMRRRTGTLYFGLGVHAGLVFALKVYPRWVHAYPEGSEWIWGANHLHDGVAGLFMLLALWAIVKWAPLPPKLRPERVGKART